MPLDMGFSEPLPGEISLLEGIISNRPRVANGAGNAKKPFLPAEKGGAGDGRGRWVRSGSFGDNQIMAKGKKKLEVIHLVCEETGDQNYTLRRKSGGEKLKVKKYSPRLRKHTLHNEKKK
jgi:large subunit ribosomal protein L33